MVTGRRKQEKISVQLKRYKADEEILCDGIRYGGDWCAANDVAELERENADLHAECDRLTFLLTGQLEHVDDTAQHTPGRWHRNVPPATKYTTIWAGRNTHVARVVTDGGLTPEEIEANCTLIAAAPKLLTALRALEQSVRDLESKPVQKAAESARVAIAQALGGQ